MAQPPVAKKIPKVDVIQDDARQDEYYWLRDKDSPDTIAYLTAENAYAEAMTAPTAAFQDALYREMLARIKEDDQSVPYPYGGWLYYSRTETGKQYAIHCRKRAPEGSRGTLPGFPSQEDITLDLNELAASHAFCALGAYSVSDDGRWLAYSVDFTGFRDYTLYIKDLTTGALAAETIEKVSSVAWAADCLTFFYVVEDDAKRPHRLLRHTLGTAVAGDTVLYEETDQLFRLGVWRSRSRALLLAASNSFTTTELRWLPATDPTADWRLVLAREHDHEYWLDHALGPGGGTFYIRTNAGGRRNFRLVTAPVDDPAVASWRELVPHRDDVMLEDIDVFADHYVVHERADGLIRLQVTTLADGQSHHIEFPEPAYEVSADANAEYRTAAYRIRYQSFVTPASVYDYDVANRRLVLLKQQPVLGGFDPARYASERIHATAGDGTRVPISLVYRAGTPRDGSSPMLLAGYGAYGLPYPVTFSSSRLSLLDRGVTVAIAHIRGGGEMGKRWHDEGRMLRKRNTFTDFIAAADHLVAAGYAARDRLVIEGGSAGGLLMGAVLNLRSDVAHAALLRVPFVDVINTMLDESLPLTVGEFEEWGNPKIREHYDYMKTYCPYTNLSARSYPVILVRTSINDSQVMYWEPAKWVARLRALNAGHPPLVFKINMAAGHGGSSGRYDALRETAFDYTWVLHVLGLDRA